MTRQNRPLFPQTQRRAEAFGERIHLARLRRRITLNDMAARVGSTRATLARLEQGKLSVSMGLVIRVLGVLGLEADLDQLARDDELGQRLQDVRLRRPRTPGRKSTDG
ncbi:MAG: helix-turn-helix domain-containing protein [Candidatus Dormibacteraceae bacterium]